MMDVEVEWQNKICGCAEKIADALHGKFWEIVAVKTTAELNGKINFIDSMNMITYAMTTFIAKNISAIVETMPVDDKAKMALELINKHEQLLDFMISNIYLLMKNANSSPNENPD